MVLEPAARLRTESRFDSRSPALAAATRRTEHPVGVGRFLRRVTAAFSTYRNGYHGPARRSTTSDWIGDTFTSEIGWNHLERLVNIGNRTIGSPGEYEAMEAMRDVLERVDARNARIDPFEIQGWKRGDGAVYTADTMQDCIALPRSPAGTASGGLVDLGYGLTEDFDRDLSGKVVVVSTTIPDHHDRFVHHHERYYYAVEAGAAAFVFANHVPGQLPLMGSVGTVDAPIGDIPAVGVSRGVGVRLRRRLDGDEATVNVTYEAPATENGNVHAELGPDTDEEVFVTSRLDVHGIAEGAMDNGADTAMVAEVARVLTTRENELDTRIYFVCFGTEEIGLIGSECEVERLGDDRANVRAIVNDDGVVAGRTLKLTTHGFDELEAAAETVVERFDHDVSTLPEQLPHNDHWPFVAHGVPAYMVGNEKEGRGRGWDHMHADTIEKLESRTLREQAILLTEPTVGLTDADHEIPHADPADIAAALEAEGQAEGMKVTGDWPF